MEAIIRPKKLENVGRVLARLIWKWVQRLVGLFERLATVLKLIVFFILNLMEQPKLTRQVEPGVPPEEVQPPQRLFEQGPMVR